MKSKNLVKSPGVLEYHYKYFSMTTLDDKNISFNTKCLTKVQVKSTLNLTIFPVAIQATTLKNRLVTLHFEQCQCVCRFNNDCQAYSRVCCILKEKSIRRGFIITPVFLLKKFREIKSNKKELKTNS